MNMAHGCYMKGSTIASTLDMLSYISSQTDNLALKVKVIDLMNTINTERK